jgi:hypothetical protein
MSPAGLYTLTASLCNRHMQFLPLLQCFIQFWAALDGLADIHFICAPLDNKNDSPMMSPAFTPTMPPPNIFQWSCGTAARRHPRRSHWEWRSPGGSREWPLLDPATLRFSLVFGQTDPRRLEIGSCHILDDTGVERCIYQILVAMQLASNHFGC